ncbi:hypothetical protein ACHQM5_010434 [Ranunculus cassubicifolius]
MQKGFFMSQIVLRVLGIAATLISIVLMITSKQTISVFSLRIEANYSYSSTFKFFVAMDSFACSLSALCLSIFLYHHILTNPVQKTYQIMFLIDLMVLVCILIGSSAATAIGYVGKYGNSHAGWMPICDQFGKFCNRSLASVVMSFFAAMIFIGLTIWSSWKATTTTKLQGPICDMGNVFKTRENKISGGDYDAETAS